MVNGIGKGSMSEVQQNQTASPTITTGNAGEGAFLSQELDAKESARAPKFGDLYKQIQAKYGEKPQKPREIKKTLGKDDFLRIMITQMKNQDPTNPFKAEQMATEIAQFTSVEQLQNVNQNLAKMAGQNKPLEQMAMTNLIGKTVTIDRERFPHMEGETESLAFNLPKDATTAKVSVFNESGELMMERDLGAQKSGQVTFNWDGIKSNNLPAKAGTYVFRVQAKDEHGKTVETNPKSQARVIGVTFEGNEPVFLVGDASHQDKVTMRNIIQIEQEGAFQSPAATASNPTRQSHNPAATPPVIPPPVHPPISPLAPPVPPSAIAQAVPSAPIQANSPQLEEKGFPNGLHELDSNMNIGSNSKINKNLINNNFMKVGDKK